MKITFVPLVVFLLKIVITLNENIFDPTLKPANPFFADEDAKVFIKELAKDYCTDDDKIANIWFHRTLDQRQKINASYYENYCEPMYKNQAKREDDGCPMIMALEHESYFHFSLNYLYSQSLYTPETILALVVSHAVVGSEKEVGAIEEVVCANNKEMKDAMAKSYKLYTEKTLEDDLKSFRKEDQDYQHVMLQYCWKGLCQEQKINPEDAEKGAQALRAINPETDKENFKNKLKELLDKNCEPDMKQIFQKYRNEKDGISDAVDKAFEVKRVRRAYNRLVRYLEDNCKFYADELNEAVKNFGTKEDKITRIILSRCEKDLGCILKKYHELYGKSFTKRLTSDTLGERRYRNSIRYLCGD